MKSNGVEVCLLLNNQNRNWPLFCPVYFRWRFMNEYFVTCCTSVLWMLLLSTWISRRWHHQLSGQVITSVYEFTLYRKKFGNLLPQSHFSILSTAKRLVSNLNNSYSAVIHPRESVTLLMTVTLTKLINSLCRIFVEPLIRLANDLFGTYITKTCCYDYQYLRTWYRSRLNHVAMRHTDPEHHIKQSGVTV